MIDKLITALSKEMEMSTEEIADTIWLALQIQETDSESVSPEFSLVEENIGANENKIPSPKSLPPTANSNETRKNQDSEAQKAKIYPQNQQQTKSLDLSFKTPNAPSLRQPLTLARALKPLMRRIPDGRNFVLDETATIERIAITNAKWWLPVLKPTLEPWLNLELVVDESISMQIWRQTIRDLEKLLKNYGIFRDVRVWGMTVNHGKVEMRRGIGAAANKFPRSTKELIDGSSRRLVLVVSDCVSPYWRDGTVTKALEIWGSSVPTAIISMLPKWLWKRTALGRASEVRLRALTPGVSNQNLIAQEVSLWEELEEKKGVKVPIFTLEEDKVKTWAQMLSGKSSVWSLGFVFKLDAPVQENSLFNLDYGKLSAEERVQAFRVTASPMARKLAGLLAASPVISLPVVRLIRAALLPECLQVNVAEVFLGGLLKPLSEIKVESNPDEVLYEFMDGVRELFIDSMPTDRVLNVVDKVSEYVAERVGLSLENFAAVLRGEEKVEDSEVVGEVGYFATVTAQVLRRLGGEYEEVAVELERNSIIRDFPTQQVHLERTNPKVSNPDRKHWEKALSNWEDKLGKYQLERSITSSLEVKFQLEKKIEESQAKIQEIYAHLRKENDQTVRKEPIFKLPQHDISTFTGREDELKQLENLLLSQQGEKVCSIVGITGGGGIGKSALAYHFATIHRDKFPDGVIGLRVDEKDINTIARRLAKAIEKPIAEDDDMEAREIMQTLFAPRRMLLIFDNAEKAKIRVLRPRGNRCAVVVTTRNQNLPVSLGVSETSTIRLRSLPEKDALDLLRKILGEAQIDSALAAAKRITRIVGGLPLALQILGGTLRGKRQSLTTYADSLQKQKEKLKLLPRLRLGQYQDFDMEACLNLSLESLEEQEIYFFACLGVCAEDGFAKRTAMAAAACEDEFDAKYFLERLYDMSLLSYLENQQDRFVLHPLLREYARSLAQERNFIVVREYVGSVNQKTNLLNVAQERHAKFFMERLQSDDFEDEMVVAEVAKDLSDIFLAAKWLQNHQGKTTESRKKAYEFVLNRTYAKTLYIAYVK